MICRALTNAGTRCTNRRVGGSPFCTRHAHFPREEMVTETFEEAITARTIMRQAVTPVPYEVVAMVLRESLLPPPTIRAIASDLAEAFRERDQRFMPQPFLELATR